MKQKPNYVVCILGRLVMSWFCFSLFLIILFIYLFYFWLC